MFNFMRKDPHVGKEDKKKKKDGEKKPVKKYTPKEPLTPEELARLEQTRQGLFAQRPEGDTESSQSSLTPSLSSSESQQSLNAPASSTSMAPPLARRTSKEYVSKTGALERGRGLKGPSIDSGGGSIGGAVRPNRGILKGNSKYGPSIPNQGVSDDIDDDATLYVNTNVNELIAAGEPAAIAAAAAAAKQTHSNSPSPLMSGPISAKRGSTISNLSANSNASVSATKPSRDVAPDLRPTEKIFGHAHLPLPPLEPALPPSARSVVLSRSPKGDFGFSLRRSVVVDRHALDSTAKKNVIFAEPLTVGKGNQTGLLPGDRLVSVNGVNVEAASREEIIELIRKSGHSLQLTVQPILELSELSNRQSTTTTTTSKGSMLSVPDGGGGDAVRRTGTLQRTSSFRNKPGFKSESESQADKNFAAQNRVWLVHAAGFTAATRLDSGASDAAAVSLRLDVGGQTLEVEDEDVEKMNAPSLDRVENVALLPFLNESSFMHTLRQRYGSNLVHTFAGPHLLVVNPMHSLSVYAEKVMQLFRGCRKEDLPPHIYATAQSAYRALLKTRKEQSIVLLGRSGSGKTSSARHVIHFLTAVAGAVNNVLNVEKLNALSTLLEAFGNTRTTMNTNATRFSQLTTLEFDYSGQVVGASIQIFLLEKSRVCRRPDGEPTFHVFYHLLAGCDPEVRAELQLQNLSEPNLFMTSPQKPEDKQRASTIWERITKAMETLGIKKEEARAIWCVLGAIYHLGCAGATKGTSAGSNRPQFAKPAPAQRAAALLGTSIDDLGRAIFAPHTHHASANNSLSPRSPASLSRSLTPSHSPSGTLDRGSQMQANTSSAAMEMLEGFVIGLYAEAFAALVSLINRNLSSTGTHRAMSTIGVLDCPGIQTPKPSGGKGPKGAFFEDLCHNYLQERLLSVFNDQAFTIPLERYAQESIGVTDSASSATSASSSRASSVSNGSLGDLREEFGVDGSTSVNAEMMAIIDKPSQHGRVAGRTSMDFSGGADKMGLFWLLDEESIFPGSTDESFVDRLFVHHHSDPGDLRGQFQTPLLTRPSAETATGTDPALPSPPSSSSDPDLRFTLHHLNGTCPVTYHAKGWLKAAREHQSAKMATVVLQDSSRENVGSLFIAMRGPIPSTLSGSMAGLVDSTPSSSLRRAASVRRSFTSSASPGIKRKTFCLQIKFQADSLTDSLRRSQCHFVHCLLPKRDAGLCDLKPTNELKAAGLSNGDASPSPVTSPVAAADNCLDVPLLREQLRGYKILEAVRLHRQGFPDHMLCSEFRRSFEILAPSDKRSTVAPLDEVKAVEELALKHLELDKNLFKLGLSRIFFRAGALAQLEDKRDSRVASTLTAFQARCRGFLVRRNLKKLQVQDLAIRCIQKNLRKYYAVKQWPWWSLYTKVLPLLNVHRTEEELTAANEELESLRQKMQKVEKEKNAMQQRNTFLESRLTELTSDLQEEQTSASHASEMLDTEVAERIRLDRDLKELTSRNSALQKKVDNLEMELYESRAINAHVDQTLEDDEDLDASFFKQKLDRTVRELELFKKKASQQDEENEEKLEQMKKLMERRVNETNLETDEMQRQMQHWKRNSQRINSEMQDLKLIMEEQQSRNAELEKKQRRFDAELNREKQEAQEYREEKEKLQREKEQTMADKFALDAELSQVKGDLEISEAKVERIEHELKDITTTTIGGDQEVLRLKRVKHELEMKLKEQEEELDEQAGTIQQLEQAKLKLEMQSSKSSIQYQKDLDSKEEELEQARFATQKRIKTLELQLEDEHEEKSTLLREKRTLEKQLREALERSPKRDKGAEKRLRGKLKRTDALLRDAQMALEKLPDSGANIKSLRNQLEDSEFAKQSAIKAKTSLETDLSEVQAQLEDVRLSKQDAERKAIDAARANNDFQSQLDEVNEELAEVMKKYKASVQQASVDHITINDLLNQIGDLEREKESQAEQLATLQAKAAYLEGSCVEKTELTRLEAKCRDLESRLDLESSQKQRMESQLARLKDANDKISVEFDDQKVAAERERETARRAVKASKEMQEEMAELQRKETEFSMRKSELETQASTAEEALEAAQTDLKLAFKRINDLQAALEDPGDSDSDLTDSEDDDESDLDDDDDDNFLQNPRLRPQNRSSGLGSAASSTHSLQSLEDSSARLSARRLDSLAGAPTYSNASHEDNDDL